MKSIGKNYIYNVVYEILTVITPLITTTYSSRGGGQDLIVSLDKPPSILWCLIFLCNGILGEAFGKL